MDDRTYNILFLSPHNRARGVIAEGLVNAMGRGRFRAFSAGVEPDAAFDPIALELLQHAGAVQPRGRPRHFDDIDAPPIDFIFTLSDKAREPTPAWPGHPVTANWRSDDPDRCGDDPVDRRRSLIQTRKELERRLRLFMNLPAPSLDRMSLRSADPSSVGNREADEIEGDREPADDDARS